MRITFHVKNGIGMGHVRRALVLADEIRKLDPKMEISFLSQVRFLDLFRDHDYPVINVPLLERQPDNVSERDCALLIESVLQELEPDLLVEDTHPDERFLSLAAVRDIPKALIVRRLDKLALNDLRLCGTLALYDQLIFLQSHEDYLAEKQVPQLDLLANYSERFRFTGPVFREPTPEEVKSVRDHYLSRGAPLIVVNAGAGGQHLSEHFVERLFQVARDLAGEYARKGKACQFLLILGPYYSGQEPTETANLRVVRFEHRLHALLSVADVVIARPGYNVVHETLSGGAQIILIPSVSYFEHQALWAQDLARLYGLQVCEELTVEALRNAVDSGLQNPLPRKKPEQAKALVAQLLLDTVSNRSAWESKDTLFLVVGGVARERAETLSSALVEAGLKYAYMVADYSCVVPHIPTIRAWSRSPNDVGNCGGLSHGAAFGSSLCGGTPSPEELIALGIRTVLFADAPSYDFDGEDWVRHYSGESYGVLPLVLARVPAGKRLQERLAYRYSRIRSSGKTPFMYLDLGHVMEGTTGEIVANLSDFCREKNIELMPIARALSLGVRHLLMEEVWSPQRLETENLR